MAARALSRSFMARTLSGRSMLLEFDRIRASLVASGTLSKPSQARIATPNSSSNSLVLSKWQLAWAMRATTLHQGFPRLRSSSRNESNTNQTGDAIE
ncbi:Uncharacterized protein TCM_020027 [Theobroma cacao]|uniref:Uncharacterized protein n=1 Tax=Theobroma cacao TaxID=3641 RepID=A0A061EJM6_THECC|nr:Uncharacterized protein TCM_020027 [Theobroma cacao]